MILYVIQSSYTGLTKIGVTSDINQRVTQLKNNFKHLGIDGGVELVYYIHHENAYKLEKLLHKYYRKFRVEGEWFKEIKDHIDIIDRFKDQV